MELVMAGSEQHPTDDVEGHGTQDTEDERTGDDRGTRNPDDTEGQVMRVKQDPEEVDEEDRGGYR
jgi:hypothetical protein